MTTTQTPRPAHTTTVTLQDPATTHDVELRPFGEVSSEVILDGNVVGTISVFPEGGASAYPATCRRYGFFRFRNEHDAAAACVSHALRGYWHNEV